MTAVDATETTTWTKVCTLDQIPRELGVAALVGDTQIAIFRTFDDTLYALGNIDPKMNAAVMARGIVGTRGDTPTVASPLLKQVYSLETGQCLDDETLSLPSFGVRIVDGTVEVAVPAEASAA